MTIGRENAPPEQPDFACLIECRRSVAARLGVEPQSLELSMGMSADFEAAIALQRRIGNFHHQAQICRTGVAIAVITGIAPNNR